LTELDLFIFDVVGKDGKETGFIEHTGLADTFGNHEVRGTSVFDMGPPLHGQIYSSRMQANVVGSASLSDDEVRKMQTFVDKHAGEHSSFSQLSRSELIQAAPQMYCIYPHASRLCEADGRYVRTRFSCAGFVFEAYKKARIALLKLDSLPEVGEDVIRSAYGTAMSLMESRGISLAILGLDGDSGAWPVLLCGYLIHALDRDANVIREQPYTPDIADRYFN